MPSKDELLLCTTTAVAPPPGSNEQLMHELRVHQLELELELQNDELRRAQAAAERARDRFVDFFESAPVGYLELDGAGLIIEINITAAALLRRERQPLLGHPFAAVVAVADADQWHIHFVAALQRQFKNECELALVCGDGTPLCVRVDSLRCGGQDQPFSLRLALTDITERKRMEMELRIVLEEAGDGIWISDADGRYSYANPSACKLTGHSREALQAMCIVDLVHEEQRGELAAHLQRLQTTKFVRKEWRLNCQGGGSVSVELTTERLPDGRYLATGRDLTEQKQNQAKFLEQEKLLDRMSAMTHIGAWSLDPKTLQGSWTAEVARIHGLPDDAPIDVEAGINYYAEEYRAQVRQAVAACIEQGQPYDLEVELLTASGQRKWIRTLGAPVVDNGLIVRVDGAIQDITTRKHADAEIRKLSMAVAQSPESIVITNMAGEIEYVNEAFIHKTGFSRAEVLGQNPRMLHSGNTPAATYAELWAALSKGEV